MTAPDEKLTFDLVARDRASREFDKVGDAAVRAGRDFDKAGDGAGQLQMQIDDSTRSLRALGDEFDRTGDRALLKDLSRESRTLRGLQKLRREMSALADATGDVSHFSFRGLTGAIESLPLQLKGALIVAAAGAITAATPLIAAGLTGAITAGVGGGVLAAGIASAARSPAVKSAWQELADSAKDVFAGFGAPFVEPTVRGIKILRAALVGMDDDLSAIAKSAAGFVEPLAAGFAGLVERMLPGLRNLMSSARPLFDMLRDELPNIGRAVSSFFDSMASGAEGGVDGLRALLRLAEFTLVALGETLEMLTRQFHDLADIARAFGAGSGPLGLLFQSAEGGTPKLLKMRDAVHQSGEAARAATPKFADLFGQFMGLDEAAIRVEQTIDNLTSALKDNGTTLDINSEKGRNNRTAFLNAVEAAERHRVKMIENGQSVAYANGVYQTTINRLYATGVQAGISRGELDKLLRKYQDISRQPNITKTIKFRQVFTQEGRAYRAPGGPVFFREGGIHYAQTGLLNMSRRAQMFPGGKTMFGFAEPGTGGEAFVARNAPRQRSLAIGAQAMRWHGASVVPWEQMIRGAYRARQSPTVIEISSGGSRMDDLLLELLRRAIRVKGGNVQVVLGKRS